MISDLAYVLPNRTKIIKIKLVNKTEIKYVINRISNSDTTTLKEKKQFGSFESFSKR